MKEIDYSRGEKITIGCILGNILLSVFKLMAGIFGGSKAMIADALHSASDIVATTVVLIGIRIARKPVDREHPYGHGKVEPLAAAFVGATLIFAAVMIVKGIIESIVTHSFATPTYLALAAAVLSMTVKEAMFRVTYAAGKKINSQSIMADAWHHRSDAYSSIGTFVGILGSIIGKRLGIHILEYMDPLAGAVVACLIFKVAYDILKHAVRGLMDASPGDDAIAAIRDAAADTLGAQRVSRIKGRYVGQHLFVDMEIEVDPAITVEAGHAIAAEVRTRIMEAVADVGEVLVHVEPARSGQRAKEALTYSSETEAEM